MTKIKVSKINTLIYGAILRIAVNRHSPIVSKRPLEAHRIRISDKIKKSQYDPEKSGRLLA